MILPDCSEIHDFNGKKITIYNILNLDGYGAADVRKLPFSIRILLENLLRKRDGKIVRDQDIINLVSWGENRGRQNSVMIPFHPARVLMQDFTGVPGVVDLAAMRDALKNAGGNPEKINPMVPVDLVIDHSVQVDFYGRKDASSLNTQKEYQRNEERYKLIKWAQKSFDNFRVVPPGSGICHQVNLEYLADVVKSEKIGANTVAFPDTLVGTDSHTTMINGLGVIGWGVGGIEAEAVMLGQPYFMVIPEVIGVKFTGEPAVGVTATDIVLFITNVLRKENVVEKFVEFTGPGLKDLPLADRATIANMAPEYGATVGFFPIDSNTLNYLEMTGRSENAALVEKYCKRCGLFSEGNDEIEFSDVVEIDLSLVRPCIAGPSRPQDMIILSDVKDKFNSAFKDRIQSESKHFTDGSDAKKEILRKRGDISDLSHGSLVIAAISSCTNTSNPYVMIGAGIAAKNAVARGLKVPEFVKTSLSPGSRVVADYLEDAGLMEPLETLGFNIAGFGCMTCIGNSGPLDSEVEKIIRDKNLVVAAAVSSNRNFEARVHQSVRANYLMSPALVVMFALAGRINVDFESVPLGYDASTGRPVFMKDIWPSAAEVEELVLKHVNPRFFADQYSDIFRGDELWQKLDAEKSETFPWDEQSMYIRQPSFFKDFSGDIPETDDIKQARVLLLLGDSVTTDHISPAGAIPVDYPAGKYLLRHNIRQSDFNSYGSRRGNHEVMMRGTFGNIRIDNRLVSGQGSFTLKFPQRTKTYVFDASMSYQKESVPLVVLGGKEYGTGSSRDWAAKGTELLGVRAVIASSFERIHRSNLVGMGVLPLVLEDGTTWDSLGIDGSELFEITGISDMKPGSRLKVRAVKDDETVTEFFVISRLDTDIELEYFKNGGILQYVLRKMLK